MNLYPKSVFSLSDVVLIELHRLQNILYNILLTFRDTEGVQSDICCQNIIKQDSAGLWTQRLAGKCINIIRIFVII